MPHERDAAMNTKKFHVAMPVVEPRRPFAQPARVLFFFGFPDLTDRNALQAALVAIEKIDQRAYSDNRSEENTSEIQSIMSISYAVFFLTKKNRSTISIN